MKIRSLILGALASTVIAWSAQAEMAREEFTVASEPGINLFVRSVSDRAKSGGAPILLVHGARVGSVASFDVDVTGYSLAESLADLGMTVYLADVRGYGRSSFPASMTQDRFSVPPAVPTSEAVKDLNAVIREVRQRHPGEPLTAMGWATGSHWLAATEAAHPGSVDRLIFYNSVYGGKGDWRLTDIFAKPGAPAEFNYEKFGGYRLSDAKSLVGRWTRAESISDRFVERYVAIAMDGDPTASSRTPGSFRHPSGPIADTLKAVHAGPLYDAGTIRSDVLILRSGKDFWSRPVDVETFLNDLTGARSVTERELPGASHYVHLEPGDQRDKLLSVLADFSEDGKLTGSN